MSLARPAVRVLCIDADDRLLLLRWRDPWSGEQLWEPPGGGVEPGESNHQTACREWREETGLTDAVVTRQYVVVSRDETWKGLHVAGDEPTFLARWPGPGPATSRDGLVQDEPDNLVESRWLSRTELAERVERVTPDVGMALSRLGIDSWAVDQ